MVCVTVLAGCGESSDSSDSSPGSLVIYSGRSEKLVGPIVNQFKDATGIDVAVKYGKTGEIVATLLEEGSNSPSDVFFAQDPGGLGTIASSNMLKPLPSNIVDLVPEWARSKDGLWVGISGRARTLVYSTENVPPGELPASIEDLTDPKWKGRMGWAPSNSSFQAMITAMRVLWGDTKTRSWLEGMKANNPSIYPKNTPQVAAAGAGEIDIGLVNHYYLHRFIAEEGPSFKARNYYHTVGGPGSLVMVAGAGILKTADSSHNAEQFLKFMLSKTSQQYFADKTYEYPLIESVETSDLLTPLSEIARPTLEMDDLADLVGTQRLLTQLGILE